MSLPLLPPLVRDVMSWRRSGWRGLWALLLPLALAAPVAQSAELPLWQAAGSERDFLGAAPIGLSELGRQSGGQAIVIHPQPGAALPRVRLWDELGRPRAISPLPQDGTATSTSRSLH